MWVHQRMRGGVRENVCGWFVAAGVVCLLVLGCPVLRRWFGILAHYLIPSLPPASPPSVPNPVCIRPHRIILVRHGQSEGNVDETAYTRIPDSKIALTHRVRHNHRHA